MADLVLSTPTHMPLRARPSVLASIHAVRQRGVRDVDALVAGAIGAAAAAAGYHHHHQQQRWCSTLLLQPAYQLSTEYL